MQVGVPVTVACAFKFYQATIYDNLNNKKCMIIVGDDHSPTYIVRVPLPVLGVWVGD